MKFFRNFALIPILLLATHVVMTAQTATPKPISQQGLTEALRIGGLTTQELIDIVRERGVAFTVTDAVEADLSAAGAEPLLIDAVRASYRSPAVETRPVQLGPLSKNEIATLLQVGTPSSRIEGIVNQRSVTFPLTPAIKTELTDAGAEPGLLNAIETAWARSNAAVLAIEKPATVPAPSSEPAPTPSATAPPTPPKPKPISIREVRKLFIEKMSKGLDEYLRAEFQKQLPSRFVLVTNKEEADAVVAGSGQQKTDTGSVITGKYLGLHDTANGAISIVDKSGTVLWSAEAGDRTLIFGGLKRGGAREVASRLIQELKKFLESD